MNQPDDAEKKQKTIDVTLGDMDYEDDSYLVELAEAGNLLAQSDRLRSENRLLRIVLVFMGLVTLATMLAAYRLAMLHIQKPVEETFFAITDDGRLTSISAEDDKYSETMLLEFAREASIQSFSFDFVQANNETHMANMVRKFYGRSGFVEYQKALADGQFLERLYANKEISTATVVGQPILVDSKTINGKVYYIIETTLHIAFIGASNSPSTERDLKVTMAITRLPVFEAVRGVGIVQIIAEFQ